MWLTSAKRSRSVSESVYAPDSPRKVLSIRRSIAASTGMFRSPKILARNAACALFCSGNFFSKSAKRSMSCGCSGTHRDVCAWISAAASGEKETPQRCKKCADISSADGGVLVHCGCRNTVPARIDARRNRTAPLCIGCGTRARTRSPLMATSARPACVLLRMRTHTSAPSVRETVRGTSVSTTRTAPFTRWATAF